MRPLVNVVSVGILLGLSLLAISVLTALYASPWQAATILAVLVGIFASVSLYCGGRLENQSLAHRLAQAQVEASELSKRLTQSEAQVRQISDILARAQAQVRSLAESLSGARFTFADEQGRALWDAQLIVHLHVLVDNDEDEPPLFI